MKKSPDRKAILEAKQNPNGWVYEIDYPYDSNKEPIPPEAIKGAWQVDSDGNIKGEFQENKNYRPIETSRRILPKFMAEAVRPHAKGTWVTEFDLRVSHLFPHIPQEAEIGYWLVGENGKLTDKFRPTSTYNPEAVAKFLEKK